jgi:hypothetical protein
VKANRILAPEFEVGRLLRNILWNYKAMQEGRNGTIGSAIMLAYVNDVLHPHGFDEINDFAGLRQMMERRR